MNNNEQTANAIYNIDTIAADYEHATKSLDNIACMLHSTLCNDTTDMYIIKNAYTKAYQLTMMLFDYINQLEPLNKQLAEAHKTLHKEIIQGGAENE